MNLNIKKLTIMNSQFSKSTALSGAFIYTETFGSEIIIEMANTSFSEGYSV